jgi:hypothetical protein
MARIPGRAETPQRVQGLQKDLREYIASVARSFARSLDDLYNRILLQIQNSFYAKADSDARYAYKTHTHDGADITSGTVTRPTNNSSSQSSQFLGGSFTGTTGSFSGGVSGSQGTFTSGVTSPGVYSTSLSTAYRAQYVDSTGKMGYVPSTRASKNVISDYKADYTKLLALVPKWATYKNDPTNTPFATFIAEDMAVNFPEYTFTDSAGNLAGIRYEMFVVALHSAVSQAAAASASDRTQLNVRLAAIEAAAATRSYQTWTNSSMTALGLNAETKYTVTWPAAFADAKYTVTCAVTSGGAALAVIANEVPGTKTATSVQVTVRTLGVALLANSTITVTGQHT